MPKAMRQALVLIGIEQRAYEEVAVALRVPAGTIKSRVSRARAFLESGDKAILETEIEMVTFGAGSNDTTKVRAFYFQGLAVSEIAVEMPHLSRFDVMGILAVNRIRGRHP